MSEKQENNPTVVTTAAEELLSSGALNEAAAYFWRASEIYTAGQQWSEAADCLMRSAYCYELDGLKDQATRDYERAAELYTRARLAAEAAHAARMARNVCQVDDIDKHSSATHTIVIGAVGLNGSGKDILIMRLHDQFGIPMISIGDIVRDIAREEGVAATRDNLHEISERYIAKFGKEYFPQRVITKIEEQKWPIVGISGIRTPTDIRTFQKHYGKNFILIHVEVTDPRVRFERMQRRGEKEIRKPIRIFYSMTKVSR